jgi:hypothetical protein
MLRQVSGDVDLSAVGRVDPDPASVEVQLAADPAGDEGLRSAIFRVADNRMTERRHMRSKLVRSASQWLELDPGRAIPGAVDHAPTGLCRKAVLDIDVHLFAARSRLLGKGCVD